MQHITPKLIKTIKIIYIMILFSGVGNASEQDYITDRFKTKDGLSHNSISYIFQDTDNFMWFGTWDGLSRFDGHSFKKYNSLKHKELINSRITTMREDSAGYIWAVTYDKKLYRFDKWNERYQAIDLPEEFRCLGYFVHTNGDVWFWSANNMIYQAVIDPGSGIINRIRECSLKNIAENTGINFIRQIGSGILIGTTAGLYQLNPENDKLNQKECLTTGQYTDFSFCSNPDDNQNVYVGTDNLGIIKYDNSLKEYIILDKTRNIEDISNIQITDRNTLLIATTSSGIYIYDLGKSEIIENFRSENNPQIVSNNIRHITKEDNSRYWIYTDREGVILFNTENYRCKYMKLDVDINPACIGVFVNKHDDKVIVNSYNQGIAIYDPQTDKLSSFFDEIDCKDNVFSLAIHNLFIDNQNNIWISPWSKSLYKINKQRNKIPYIYPAGKNQNEMANEIRAITEDKNDNIWIGTREGGLFCYDKQKRLTKHYRNYIGIDGKTHFMSSVYSLMVRRNGEIWAGTKGYGIIQIKPDSDNNIGRQLNMAEMSNLAVYSMCEDKLGRIWIATFGKGLMMIENVDNKLVLRECDYFKFYPQHHRSIRILTLDRNENIWVGTTDGPLMFNTNIRSAANVQFSIFVKDNYKLITYNDVHTIMEDYRGRIWIGSSGGGLSMLELDDSDEYAYNHNGYKVESFNEENGLPSNTVISLCEDNFGTMWIGTENNISNFNYRSKRFYNFSNVDGFKDQTISEKCGFATSQGELIFGTTDGFLYFNPQSIQTDNYNFKLAFTDFKILNNASSKEKNSNVSLIEGKEIILKHDQSFFSIEYAALDYVESGNINYAYMMESIETGWNYVKDQRKATYTDLKHGKYLFKVRASKDSVFDDNDPAITLRIIILPPWWLTIYAKIFYLIVVLLVMYILLKVMSNFYKIKHKVKYETEFNEMRLRFFTNISHELRTPITLIMGPVEKLLSNSNTTNEDRELLTYISHNAQKLIKMVNQILDFRKIQSNKMELRLEKMELIDFSHNIFNNFSSFLIEKNIHFAFDSNVESITAMLDSEKLDVVIYNLLSNAVKFTPGGGNVNLKVNLLEHEKKIEIVVEDTGIGIASESLPLIFERFASNMQNTKTKYKGTGIGLHLVKSLVDLHNGKIVVDSEPNKGSKFKIILPYIECNDDFIPCDNPKEPDQELNDQHKTTILIVDDNFEFRNFMVMLLRNKYDIMTADNGKVAINMINKRMPEMIISDIMMPEMNGIELLKHIRDDIKTSHIPFMLLSAKNSVDDQIEGIRCGADDYINKPFNTRLLETKILNVFDRRRKIYDEIYEGYNVVSLSPDSVVVPKRDEELLRNVIAFIESNLDKMNDFGIEDIVKSLGLSRTIFYNKIKSLTGLSPVELVRDIRIKRGAQLVLSGEFSISEISMMVGFSDVRYFSKCFKNKFGVNPSEYK